MSSNCNISKRKCVNSSERASLAGGIKRNSAARCAGDLGKRLSGHWIGETDGCEFTQEGGEIVIILMVILTNKC